MSAAGAHGNPAGKPSTVDLVKLVREELALAGDQRGERPAGGEASEGQDRATLRRECKEAALRKLDDPVRWYFSLIAQFPLLSREEERSLAQAIDSSRADFQALVYSTRFAQEQAVELLGLVLGKEIAVEKVLDVDLSGKGERERFFVELARDVASLKSNLAAGPGSEEKSGRRSRWRLEEKSRILARYNIRLKILALWKGILIGTARPSDGHHGTNARIARAFSRYEEAKKRLASGNLRLVVNVAKRYRGKGLTFLDLIQEGNAGLMRATEKFDHRKGYRFSTYATWWVRQSVHRALEDKSRLIRLPSYLSQGLIRVLKKATQIENEAQVAPDPLEIAREIGLPEDEVRQAFKVYRHPVSLDAPLGGDEDGATCGELLKAEQGRLVEDLATREDLAGSLEQALDSLNFREREILKFRYGIGMEAPATYEEIAGRFRLSRERVRQIEFRALARLRASRHARRLEALAGLEPCQPLT